LDSAYNGEPSEQLEFHEDDLAKAHVKEYGYSFWMRFLIMHPVRLVDGKKAEWYFVSRLT
jgi:hypothetical protein